jgi:5-oxoprolinase (ATP-hydrolysing) subunit A
MNASREKRLVEPGQIDVNADLGEGFASDRALLDLVTSANICCGAHAGNPLAIRQTLCDASTLGVCIGAHPGYPDRPGFGRREQILTTLEVMNLISSQTAELMRLAAEVDARVLYLKPHGALYNQAQRDRDVAGGVVRAARSFGFPLLGLPGSLLETEARNHGVVYVAEGFPDRRYRADGSLSPRSEPGAILHEQHEIEEQVVRLVREGRVATLCIHGDEPGAVDNAALVRLVLKQHGIAVRSFLDGSG